jgi:asparagine synthase (glutamine-hydrolysing)
MCGINGIFAYQTCANGPERAELVATRDHMRRRGPDGAGEWWSPERRLGLGHRRLSIIDISDRASQPMSSTCGRYTVVFNGEIYNYLELRRELEEKGVVFRTNSDTESLLHLYARDGADMVHRLRGMFAFAIWDARSRSLFLARDPYGIKPLYISDDGWTFRFASQVKALLAGGRVSRDPEPAGIAGFHLWGSVPEPYTLYRNIRALPAGHVQFVDEAGPHPSRAYASISRMFADGAAEHLSHIDIDHRVKIAMRESVAAHLLADVEVGVFLSAGVDSGALLGLMRDVGQRSTRAITLTFSEFAGTAEDEAPLAAKVAAQYGAKHIVRMVGEAEFQSDLPAILAAMDQPSIDGVNTWFVAKAAQESGLKVALSGLGGDEILAGYPSFREIPKWTSLFGLPSKLPGAGWTFRKLVNLAGVARRNPKAVSLVEYGGCVDKAYFLRRALFLPFELKTVLDPEMARRGLERLQLFQRLRDATPKAATGMASQIASLESTLYMRNQLLRDADWAGMAHSVEIRTPFVDVRLLRELSPLMPCLKTGDGKRSLAAAPDQPLPGYIVTRAKTGFGVPTNSWAALAKGGRTSSRGGASRVWASQVYTSTLGEPQIPMAPRSGSCTESGVAPVLASGQVL